MITTQAHSVYLCGFVHSFVWYFLPSFRGTTDICTDSYISSATTSSLTLSLILLVPLISILTSQRKNKSYAHLPGTTQHVAHGHSAVLGKLHPDCSNHRLQFCWVKAEVNELFIEILWPSTSCWFQPLWTTSYARQIGNQSIFPQFCGVNIKKHLSWHHLVVKYCSPF